MSGLSSTEEQETDTVDEIKVNLSLNDLPPKTQLNIDSIDLLENVSTQLLKLLKTSSVESLIQLTVPHRGGSHEVGVFDTLLALFIQVKKVYTDLPLLRVGDIAPGLWLADEQCPYVLKPKESLILAAIRKANIVTYLLSLMGRFQYGFSFLDENFIDIFCPEGRELPSEADRVLTTSLGRLLKPQAVLYLNLKTQAYISAMEPWKECSLEELARIKQETLDQVFPVNMKAFLLAKKRLRTNRLSPSEEDFMKRCWHRREKLAAHLSLDELAREYDWLDFFKEIFFYVQRNLSLLVWGRRGIDRYDHHGDSESAMRNDILTVSKTSDARLTAEQDLSSELVAESLDCSVYPSSKSDKPPVSTREPKTDKRPKQKRLWTKEEEAALIEALKANGPAWSKILELHGAGGSRSEALKRRTQVQLKDKARNWKMYFLKGGLSVPDYLMKVTGDLERDERSRLRFRSRVGRMPSASPKKDSSYSP
ncbi:LAME_0F04456g1_1 [Lachancea meyersii CBS 8951]|uniref:LAME_0F04456g1_1 n=1 Tax=Lachancea meyersii CBS 8951 TaxID=1266667 RepID=A0A1G4JS40_9SACH|nr:LAME_0F04456g1_1 [Lachancea meyersii CBS 8951]